MENVTNDQVPVFSHVEPVLAVKSVIESVAYWQTVLGFPDKWIWDPPTIGGVSWNSASFIQFLEDPELAAASAGNSVWIRLRNIDPLYELHQKNGATIVDPLQIRPWGFAQYTVRDINGYYVHFAAQAKPRNVHQQTSSSFRIVTRIPTLSEQSHVARGVGWLPEEGAAVNRPPSESIACATVAEDAATGEVIGCAFLIGIKDSFYYIREVMVVPAWQNNRVGTALMQGLIDWLKANVSPKATVGLFTGDHLAPFYKQFGFAQTCGLYRQVGDL
jgi:GNAT superfamily N-acetyltransferase